MQAPGTNRTRRTRQGWSGWDDYAPFYDWENAHTFGRRDVAFWRDLVGRERGRVLELGCGTGRLLAPLAKVTARPVGVDRSAAMLTRASARFRRLRVAARPALVRADIRRLPFGAGSFDVVLAPYGMLQSLLDDRDLRATLASTARVLRPGGLFGIDLVPDLPAWREYRRRVSLRGRTPDGSAVTLIESVRQDRRRRWTVFQEEFVRSCGSRREVKRFQLTFRTLPVPAVVRRLERAGFRVEAVLGGYDNRPWDPRADVWVVLARAR